MRPRFTERRREILNAVKSANAPVSTKSILQHLPSNPDVSTVYRALDFLEKEGFVHSVSFSRKRYYYTDDDGGCGHFLFCRHCHEILRFEECSAEDLQESLQERFQYRIQKHVLSFEGVCSECQAFLEKKAHVVQ